MMRIIPLTIKQANTFIVAFHRHHKPVQGHRFSIGLVHSGSLVGVAVIGRPVGRGCDAYMTAEVTRLATDGTKNACSALYGAAARIARGMGFAKIQTYLLETEPGTSLKASGWSLIAKTAGGEWKHTSGPRRTDQPNCPKQRWERELNPPIDFPTTGGTDHDD